ncbi:WD repeat-containing protein [Reticulomyxa filosa]|uniref:WD repeat-containing protein n=1 Tax=Reticulomyxa filosa TaxID=46433 RepID=X6MS86_RETFI|nr:WD repeat-containing protein [Reticulomyxa filosa]|eukprot:ETO16709.1 WD repeat-containing protein [Reticulomyxa filosa]
MLIVVMYEYFTNYLIQFNFSIPLLLLKKVQVFLSQYKKKKMNLSLSMKVIIIIVKMSFVLRLKKNIHFWDFKHNKQLQIFNEHNDIICGIEFSPFNGGRYLCSGSYDKTICLWDVET